jgi:hypothetical protein
MPTVRQCKACTPRQISQGKPYNAEKQNCELHQPRRPSELNVKQPADLTARIGWPPRYPWRVLQPMPS